MEIKKIAVIGAGTMGNGIAQVCATNGFNVVMIDVDPHALERALETIAKSADKLHSKGKITDEQHSQLQHISTASDLGAVTDADIVIEAVTENFNLKKQIFTELDTLMPPDAILASNTSSISLTALAALTKRPNKVIGMHFMNPVPIMQLVEVIRALDSDQATVDTVVQLARDLGKTPIEANDYPGFISNRILCPMLNEAIYALMENVGNVEAIDTVMRLGMNHPMGPLMLSDFIGLDVVLAVMDVLWENYHDSKYRACPLLRKMVAGGHLGRKSGHGFYLYDETGRPIGPAFT
jgi:3-hydroxybutyryl-CoA dehydrogenase